MGATRAASSAAIRRECPECRTMAYSDIARCAACGALLADAPDVSRTHVIAYTVFGVAVAALLLFAAYFYR